MANQRSHGIVEDEIYIFVFVSFNGREARFISFASAFKNAFHFGPSVFQYDVFDVCNEHGIAHNGNLVDMIVTFKHIYRVFDNHFSCHLEKLFGCGDA